MAHTRGLHSSKDPLGQYITMTYYLDKFNVMLYSNNSKKQTLF